MQVDKSVHTTCGMMSNMKLTALLLEPQSERLQIVVLLLLLSQLPYRFCDQAGITLICMRSSHVLQFHKHSSDYQQSVDKHCQ